MLAKEDSEILAGLSTMLSQIHAYFFSKFSTFTLQVWQHQSGRSLPRRIWWSHVEETACLAWERPDPWWRHQMETFSALLAICAANSPVGRISCILFHHVSRCCAATKSDKTRLVSSILWHDGQWCDFYVTYMRVVYYKFALLAGANNKENIKALPWLT